MLQRQTGFKDTDTITADSGAAAQRMLAVVLFAL